MPPIYRAKQQTLLGKAGFIGMMFVVAVGGVACQTKPVAPTPKPAVAHPPKKEKDKEKEVAPKVVDTKAQQLNYDQGIRAYSMERYEEAKAAFQRAVDLGPQTDLGVKARENLKKVVQVLKTVEEIKAK